jgi:small-conductance mechanosensitive channel/CRP-like cAMP-binding protein
MSGFDGWFSWGLALFVGLPVAVVALGEASQALRSSAFAAYCKPLDLFRGSALFLLFASLLLRKVVGLPEADLAVRIVDTALWIAVLNAALALVNTLLFDRDRFSRAAQTPKLLVDLGRLLVVAIGAAIIVSYVWKIDLTGLIAALGVGSVVIGLALQDSLGNIFSGLVMLSSSPFRIGSWIKLGDIEGQVRTVSMRSLTVALPNGDLVDIPNNVIAKDKMRVLGAAQGWTNIVVDVKVDHEFAPERVRAAMLQAADSVGNVLKTPAPVVILKGFDGQDIIYGAVLYVATFPHRTGAASEFLAYLWYIAGRENIRLRPLDPATEFRLVTPEGALDEMDRAPPGAQTPGIVDELEAIGAFELPRHALEQLASHARRERYRKGEYLLRPEHRPQAAYVICQGEAQPLAERDGEPAPWSFSTGDLVLFKSFFRGGASRLYVRCTSDLDVVRIPMDALNRCLAQEAGLAQTLEHMLSAREAASGVSRAELPDPDAADRVNILKALFKV